MIDVTDEQLEIVSAILRRWVPTRDIRVFGSRVTGKARSCSDLDIVVVGGDGLPIETLAGLRDDFEESDLPFRVDIVDWQAVSETFRETIMHEGVQIIL